MRKLTGMPRSFDLSRRASVAGDTSDVPLSGSRAQSMQRLQIGIGGVVLMVLLVGLASLIQDRTREVDATLVPAAAPTTEPSAAPQQNNPLVEAGVVPDLPAQPDPVQNPATTPDRGTQDAPQREP